ncbi:S8 family peptidase [Clostridium saccharobutylicum]|uniref:Subtilase family protein n=1 Tax=Clostridium saccharobutylicum TaxID=169679 RepID=A0A1S8N5H7_CLOSA|nr:S8 family peptidase [Clostridium saccharobutylicum]OOM11776.1 subtilase family protein [Clostridium saccharobutylicum]
MKQSMVPEKIFSDPNYYHYMVQYQGNIEDEVSKMPGYYATIINDNYAIISISGDLKIDIGDIKLTTVVYVKPTEMYTLQDVSPIEASGARFLQLNLPLSLNGKGVNVAVIDSGIDYLSDEFMTVTGETRVECIWDQTIISNEKDNDISVPFGTVYRKEKISDAIKAYREGKSPYDIVPSRDQIGHGTNMSGIIGATGKNPELKGVVPECDFVVVKLMIDASYQAQFDVKVPVFNLTSIFSALEFLYEYALKSRKPMIVYFPLGTNLGSHKGNGILEEYIESITSSSGIVLITGAGNQRDAGGHTSGIISQVDTPVAIELEVSPEQKHLIIDIWTEYPNVMTIDIVSPSGENTGIIPSVINSTRNYTFVFEKTSIRVNYYFPEESTGDELIRIRFYNLQPGIWLLRLRAKYILSGIYNAWLPQRGITVGNTKFSSSDPYGTVTNPGTSPYVVTAAAYNQNNNNVLNYSGMAFRDNFVDVIDVAAGGVNALTVAPSNKTAIVNGTSVSAAVVAGACVMLFQWGIVQGNDPYIYSQTVKAYLAKGTTKRSGDIYPNARWGYGILDIVKMFQNME